MEYEKIVNLLDDASNQPSKLIAKSWVEINGIRKNSKFVR